MNAASPRRRAALAPLDANAASTTTPPRASTTGKHAAASHAITSSKLTPLPAIRKSSSSLLLSSAPVLLPPPTRAVSTAAAGTPSVGGKKRPGTDVDAGQDQQQQAVKRSKLDHERDHDQVRPESTQSSTTTMATTTSSATAVAAERSRTHSPDVSSLFDSADADSTWATTTTEPDLVAPVLPVVPRPSTTTLTREQARERVEILRLRLGLASYKLRTGQVDVPLANLQPRRLPPVGTPPPPVIVVENMAEQQPEREEDVVEETPPQSQESSALEPAPVAVVAALAAMATR